MNRTCLLVVGLAPVLGASQTLAQGSAIGLYAVTLTGLHQALLALLCRHLGNATQTMASLVLLAAIGSCLQLALVAWQLPLAMQLGPWPVLLAAQCLLVDHLLGNPRSWRTLAVYLGSLLAASMLLGACRQGLGQWAGIQLANLTPGALILLGLLLSLYNRLKTGKARPSREGKP